MFIFAGIPISGGAFSDRSHDRFAAGAGGAALGGGTGKQKRFLCDEDDKRHREREKLTFSYDQNILAMQGGTKGTKGMKGTKVIKK